MPRAIYEKRVHSLLPQIHTKSNPSRSHLPIATDMSPTQSEADLPINFHPTKTASTSFFASNQSHLVRSTSAIIVDQPQKKKSPYQSSQSGICINRFRYFVSNNTYISFLPALNGIGFIQKNSETNTNKLGKPLILRAYTPQQQSRHEILRRIAWATKVSGPSNL